MKFKDAEVAAVAVPNKTISDVTVELNIVPLMDNPAPKDIAAISPVDPRPASCDEARAIADGDAEPLVLLARKVSAAWAANIARVTPLDGIEIVPIVVIGPPVSPAPVPTLVTLPVPVPGSPAKLIVHNANVPEPRSLVELITRTPVELL